MDEELEKIVELLYQVDLNAAKVINAVKLDEESDESLDVIANSIDNMSDALVSIVSMTKILEESLQIEEGELVNSVEGLLESFHILVSALDPENERTTQVFLFKTNFCLYIDESQFIFTYFSLNRR